MFGSPLLGMAIGLVLLFTITALLCSGITETVSNLFQMRAKYLLTGMRTLLDGPEEKEQYNAKPASDGKEPKQASPTKSRATSSSSTLSSAGRRGRRGGQGGARGHVRPHATQAHRGALRDPTARDHVEPPRLTPPQPGFDANPQPVRSRLRARSSTFWCPRNLAGTRRSSSRSRRSGRRWRNLPPEMPVRRQLLVFLAAAEGKVEAFELSVEQWYDE